MGQTELIRAETPAPAAAMPAVMTPAHMLAVAVQQGADLDRMQQLMDLQERWEAAQARKAYVAAMAKFKSDPPEILKSKQVSFGNTHYKHALLSDVCSAAIAGLAAVGISHSWDVDQTGNSIKVTCVLTHELGHSERVTMTAPPDTSGQKNSIQAIGSSITYLQRYTLLAATGLAAREQDDDGRAAGSRTAQASAPQEPGNYAEWKADMTALADEGTQALQASWKRSARDLRDYATRADAAWWDAMKAKAAKVTP